MLDAPPCTAERVLLSSRQFPSTVRTWQMVVPALEGDRKMHFGSARLAAGCTLTVFYSTATR